MHMGLEYQSGGSVLQSDTRALEMYIRAAELGHNNAYALIAHCYEQGSAVEEDLSKSIEFLEVAAKKGSIYAHRRLAHFAVTVGMDLQKSYNHMKVAACAGCQKSMDNLMKVYKMKELPKEELAQTLRAFQASSNEMKSKDRDDARTAKLLLENSKDDS